ncbi:helix-turn-helix transcriptional regulator [Chitinimonas sp. JJ19]|uniref:helix-turn-helix transcriptional regulator n=1 Tax=Chitinimonas sp. JJ19 TaxID=3109352 RepID=UPI002FFE1CFC
MAELKIRQYDLLVTSIHAVVLEPTKWDHLLRRIGEAIDASSGGFYLRDKHASKPRQWHSFGHSEQSLASYADRYVAMDPWTMIVNRTPVGEWVAEHQHFDDAFVAKNEFFQRYMLPNGLRRLIGTRAFDDGRIEALIGFQRGPDAEPFSDSDTELLTRLSPHLELACRLSTEFSRLRMQAAVARQALDRLAAPIWVLDGDGRVLFANHAADEGGLPGMAVRQGRLLADAPAVHARLTSLLTQATSRTAQSGALALERQDGGRLTVLVAPLPAGSPLVADSQRPLVLLMAHDPSASDAQPLDVLAALYGLSPAECRLAALLLEGWTPAESAERLQVQVSTVRTQLKSMFWKTGTHRQGELMKLLSGALLLKV